MTTFKILGNLKIKTLLRFHCAEYFKKLNTVKLGYNELGYNEHSVITNNFLVPIGHFTTLNNPVITNNFSRSRAVRYNRVSLYLFSCGSSVPRLFYQHDLANKILLFNKLFSERQLPKYSYFQSNPIIVCQFSPEPNFMRFFQLTLCSTLKCGKVTSQNQKREDLLIRLVRTKNNLDPCHFEPSLFQC